ncbi:MAG: hypothetical protein Q7J48_04875 [Nocardioides sp.]|nr:hypothetical protein [Nocardioides sp.]
MRLPSPSLLVSVAALVIATGGTSYALATIGSDDIRNGSILPQDIKDGQLKTNDIADGGLLARDFAEGQLPQGAQGEPGVGRWALVNAAGQIEASSGGFTVASAYDQPGAPAGAVGNVYINANEDLSDNGIVVSIALQNQVDQNADTFKTGRVDAADANPEFSGEITATMCGIAGVVGCAPTGTNTTSHFVVSPRLSDGRFTVADNRKRFYVVITGDSSDYVAPAA